MNLAGRIYVSLKATWNSLARWYDLLWLLIPGLGILGFVLTIEARNGD